MQMRIGEIDGVPLYFNIDSGKFSISLDIKGTHMCFIAMSKSAIEKQIRAAKGEDIVDAIQVGWYRPQKPKRCKVTVSGKMIYCIESNGRKVRVAADSYKRYEEDAFKKLDEIYETIKELEGQYEAIRRKLGQI